MAQPTEITIVQLARLIGTPDCPVLIDVCTNDDFAIDPRLIPGSTRRPFNDILSLAPQLAGKRVITICHKGLKLSHGAAALLRTKGINAEALESGVVGWRTAGQPMITPPPGHLWVTRARPKIDRIACPWLIRRFIDPAAQFLFVPPAYVQGVADRFDAIPFDIEDGFWSHRQDLCTFDTILAETGLSLPALDHLAMIIRAADTNRHDLAPEAAGLLAVSLGLSRMHRDDLDQLDAAMPVYDALYRWCRDAQSEGHDWPTAIKPASKPANTPAPQTTPKKA